MKHLSPCLCQCLCFSSSHLCFTSGHSYHKRRWEQHEAKFSVETHMLSARHLRGICVYQILTNLLLITAGFLQHFIYQAFIHLIFIKWPITVTHEHTTQYEILSLHVTYSPSESVGCHQQGAMEKQFVGMVTYSSDATSSPGVPTHNLLIAGATP